MPETNTYPNDVIDNEAFLDTLSPQQLVGLLRLILGQFGEDGFEEPFTDTFLDFTVKRPEVAKAIVPLMIRSGDERLQRFAVWLIDDVNTCDPEFARAMWQEALTTTEKSVSEGVASRLEDILFEKGAYREDELAQLREILDDFNTKKAT